MLDLPLGISYNLTMRSKEGGNGRISKVERF